MGAFGGSWRLLLLLALELPLPSSLSGSRVCNSKIIFRDIGKDSEEALGGLPGIGGHVLLGRFEELCTAYRVTQCVCRYWATAAVTRCSQPSMQVCSVLLWLGAA